MVKEDLERAGHKTPPIANPEESGQVVLLVVRRSFSVGRFLSI